MCHTRIFVLSLNDKKDDVYKRTIGLAGITDSKTPILPLAARLTLPTHADSEDRSSFYVKSIRHLKACWHTCMLVEQGERGLMGGAEGHNETTGNGLSEVHMS